MATTCFPSVAGVESTWVAFVCRANRGTARSAVRTHRGPHEADDDATMLAMRFLAAGQGESRA